jgi:phenylacetate-CoA ligase
MSHATATQALYDAMPIPLQEVFVSAAGWISFRRRFGKAFQTAFTELQRTDLHSADQVREDQDRRLREAIRSATTTVPHYRDLFRREGIDPASIQSVEDLPRIPMLSKGEVQDNPESLRSLSYSNRKLISVQTSGTTGTPLQLVHDPEAFGWEYAVNFRQRGWFGIGLGERFAAFGGQLIVPPDQKEPPYWRRDRPGNRTLFSLYHMSPDSLRDYALELHRPIYRFWQGYPSSIGLVCQHLEDVGVELGNAEPKAVFTSSETLLDFHREIIERVTSAPVADRYGNAEFCVSALQCAKGQYHIDTEFCVIEIDPHEETEEWVRGEVIATGLTNRAMPFIRYRTGDVATLHKKKQCTCGRKRPLLEQIDGRIEDYIVTPDGRRIGRLDHIFKEASGIREAQIVQNAVNHLTVRLVPNGKFDAKSQSKLDGAFEIRLGKAMQIDYEEKEFIDRGPNGKFRSVVSELDAPNRSNQESN